MSLITNSTPAERSRGCVFSELFSNTQKVAENGGTITGAPTINNGGTFSGTAEYIDYSYTSLIDRDNHTITVDFEFTAGRGTTQILAQWGDGVDTANSGAIVITTNDTIRFSVNNGVAVYSNDALTTGRHTITCRYGGGAGVSRATAVDGVEYTLSTTAGGAGSATAGITIGAEIDNSNPFLGTIYSVKIFNNQLTLQEHTDYYNDATYGYINEAIPDYPMGMAQHDATNTQTLDVTGNYNADFGAATAEPVKLTNSPGYTFDGSNDFIAMTGFTKSDDSAFTISSWFKASTVALGYILGYYTAPRYWVLWLDASGFINARIGQGSGGSLLTATGNKSFVDDSWHNAVWTFDGVSKIEVFVDGVSGASASGAFSSFFAATTPYIGARNSADVAVSPINGSICKLKYWSSVLTQTQIKDLYQREFKKLNDK